MFYLNVCKEPAGNIEITQYDQNLNPIKITRKDPSGREKSTTLRVYDKKGRKIREVSPNVYANNPSMAHNLKQNCDVYTYYDNGLLKEYKDPENNRYSYVYDANGNIIRETTPDNAEYIREYDGLGRITRVKFKDPLQGQDEILQEEYFYERGENIDGYNWNRASKSINTKYIDEDTSLRTDVYYNYNGQESVIENPYKKVCKDYYGDGNLKEESVFSKSIQYNTTFQTLASRTVYYYNNRGLLDVEVTSHKEENHRTKYFIKKYGYTEDGLLDYEINWLDAYEISNISDKTPLPKDKRGKVTRYSYNQYGENTDEWEFIGECPKCQRVSLCLQD